ncbi:MAG: GNAT family N-acetyltransferase [Terracidiphilus sp.]|nr:GNAT family N-acetyltransferase [Terracidiphilus sp.]
MIVIRSCHGHDELEACVQMQIDIWGYDPTDVIPRKAFLVMQKVGGQVIGAFDTSMPRTAAEGEPKSLVGFAMSLPGMKTGDGKPKAYLHSHMLAVRPEYRNRGLGAQLKLEQRREALGRGIELMEWTFDPLEIKNAYLNIHKLGAIIRRYSVNFYGVSSSRLQGGLPTDRLTAEWHMSSPHVTGILEGNSRPAYTIDERIEVPAAIYEWKASEQDRVRAAEVQLRNRLKFQEAFSRGLAVLGFVRDEEGNGVFELGSPAQLELK